MTRGPIPNRSDDLSRAYDANRKGNVKLSKGISVPSSPFDVDEDWDDVVKRLYESTINSGIARYYEQSDWAMLYVLCDEYNEIRETRRKFGKTPAVHLTTVLSSFKSLGLTEGDRRSIRIELEAQTDADAEGDATVSQIDHYRAKLKESFEERGS